MDIRKVNSLYDCREYQQVQLSLTQRLRQAGSKSMEFAQIFSIFWDSFAFPG